MKGFFMLYGFEPDGLAGVPTLSSFNILINNIIQIIQIKGLG